MRPSPEVAALSRVGRRAGPSVPLTARRARASESTLADALSEVASALRGGVSVRAALEGAADRPAGVAVGWVGLHRDLAAGGALGPSLRRWSGQGTVAGAELAAAVLALAAESGGAAAEAIDGVATTLRDRAAVRAEARALGAQAHASVVVLVGAPVVFGVLAAGADPRVAGFFGSPPGVGCIALAVLLDAAGAWWMSRIVGRR